LRLEDKRYPEVKLNESIQLCSDSSFDPYLWHVVVLLVFLTIVVHQCATHAEVWHNWRMLFLKDFLLYPIPSGKRQRRLTEYSHRTKLLVSLRLKSVVRCNPSPILPPLPTLRPALSFFFFAVRTLLKRISMLVGNCKAGRWNERASCFESLVLY
jgi:hypothetical protein